jgi:hypothetical protein
MAFGSGKKPANQGSAAPKAPTQGVKKSVNPSPAKPGASKILFSIKPSGTKGSGRGTK